MYPDGVALPIGIPRPLADLRYVKIGEVPQPPYYIAEGETVMVDDNCQMLYLIPIHIDGCIFTDGALAEV